VTSFRIDWQRQVDCGKVRDIHKTTKIVSRRGAPVKQQTKGFTGQAEAQRRKRQRSDVRSRMSEEEKTGVRQREEDNAAVKKPLGGLARKTFSRAEA
jgi:hypothetical protein